MITHLQSSGRGSRAPPASTIAVRTRLRDASPTINKQLQQHSNARTKAAANNSSSSPSPFQSRYAKDPVGSTAGAANVWGGGPPSPTRRSSGQHRHSSSHNNNNINNTTTNLVANASAKLRSRAAHHMATTNTAAAAAASTATNASPAKTHATSTTAPSSSKESSAVSQEDGQSSSSIALTRRRLSQPIQNTPPRQYSYHHAAGGGSSRPYQPPPSQSQSQHNRHHPVITHVEEVGVVDNHHPSYQHQQQQHTTESESLECDYDTSATRLYELLEASQWDDARLRCRSHPTEARTWIVRRDTSKKALPHKNIRWKLLPLHAAIIFQSPHTVLSALLDKYPEAAACPDDQGMLPLHLAFRHKHDDEDLIELLLVQYPQAVLVKDKRQRLPLEHGRESKFSAKLMWLYADATVIGQTGGQSGGVHNQTQGGGGSALSSLNASLRNDLENELRREHERELSRLRYEYETQLQAMQEKTAYETQHIKVIVDDERQTLIERHKEEVDGLKDILNQQAEREANITADLQAQIDDLQNALDNAGQQNNGLTAKYGKMEEFNRALRNQLQTIIRDQLFIRDLATRQNNELDAARKMRAQIIQTLMQQEDADSENDRLRSNKVIEVSETVRDRLHDLLRSDPSENEDDLNGGGGNTGVGNPLTSPGELSRGGTPSFGPSRIEVERGGHEPPQVGGSHFAKASGNTTNAQPQRNGGFFDERDAVFLAKIPELELRDANDALGDMKSLGDEISGITEHSPF